VNTEYQIKGSVLKGVAAPPTMAAAELIRAEKKALGLRVVVRQRHETFLGERFPCDPPVIRVRWEP
jgi:hypothetical protein